MATQYTLKKNEKPKKTNEIRETKKMGDTVTDDAPALTPEQYAAFAKAVAERNRKMKKSTVSIRLDNQSIEIAKSLDENYTSFLARVIFRVLRDPELLEKCI